jgi:hypothetical protein
MGSVCHVRSRQRRGQARHSFATPGRQTRRSISVIARTKRGDGVGGQRQPPPPSALMSCPCVLVLVVDSDRGVRAVAGLARRLVLAHHLTNPSRHLGGVPVIF